MGLSANFTSQEMADVFTQECVTTWFPTKIVSDREPIFIYEFWTKINKL